MKKKELDVFGFDIEGNNLYFNAHYVNGIFRMDIVTGNVEYMTISEKDNIGDCQLFQDAKVDGGRIWFSPYSADRILLYDLLLDKSEYINIPHLTGHGRNKVKFYGLYDYGECFILVPVEYPAILKVNKETYQVKIIKWEEKLLEKYPDFLKINTWLAIAWDFEVVDGMMYLLAENVVIMYNMETDELSFVQMNNEGRLYTGIAQYGDGFLLVDRKYSKLVMWNKESNSKEKIDIDLGYRGMEVGDDGCPLGLFNIRKGIVVVQAKADFLLYLDEIGVVHKINLNITRDDGQDLLFSRVKQKENLLILPLDGQNKILLVDTDDWSQRCIKMDLESLDFAQIREKMEKEDYLVENRVCFQLTDYIGRIKKCEGKENIDKKVQGVGMQIFRTM